MMLSIYYSTKKSKSNSGDAFIRLLLKSPEKVNVSKHLVQEVLRQFYLNLWSTTTSNQDLNTALALDVFSGVEHPSGVLEVETKIKSSSRTTTMPVLVRVLKKKNDISNRAGEENDTDSMIMMKMNS